ncbi:MAG: hypothetical protein ACLGIR_00365 [Actinomycetes bacterium]
MADLRGGVVSEITNAATRAQATSDETAAAAVETQNLVGSMQSDVDALSQTMARAFDQLADRMRTQVRQTSEQLHSTEWHGQSREALVRFDQDVNATMSRFMDASQAGVESFRGELQRFLASFYDQVRGEFTTAMTDIQNSYAEASQAANRYAQQLTDLDESSIRY